MSNTIDRAADLKDLPHNEQLRRARRAKEARWDAMRKIEKDGEERGALLASEQRDFEAHSRELDAIQNLLDECRVDYSKIIEMFDPTSRSTSPGAEYRDGEPLGEGQSFAQFARARGLDRTLSRGTYDGDEQAELSLRRCLRGVVLGKWDGAEAEQRAMSGLTGAAGGVMLPISLSAKIIDLARNQARVLQAGAQVVPMATRKVTVPRWAADPTPGWRAENSLINESDAMLDAVELNAKTMAVITRASREWLEDVDGGEAALLQAFAAKFALSLDLAALYGSGASDQPKGVKTNSDVTKTPLAANGAVPTWADLAAAVGRLRDDNEEPTAQIMADRTKRGLELQRENGSTGPFLAPPVYLDGVKRLSTAQVPTNLTQGTSASVASDMFTADWSQLFVGIRTDLQIEVIKERYADAGQVGFLGWFRGDVAVARPSAFDVVTGVLAP